MRSLAVLVVALCASGAMADVYLHNPRGSNDRCDRKSNNRQNGDRLFDSQNNAAGGYGTSKTWRKAAEEKYTNGALVESPMEYIGGSELHVAFTSQHGCGVEGVNDCQYVFQLGCDFAGSITLARDGTPTKSSFAEGGKDGTELSKSVKLMAGTKYESVVTAGQTIKKLNNGQSSTCANTIPEKSDADIMAAAGGKNVNNLSDRNQNNAPPGVFGKHESYEYYQRCRSTMRNRGVWAADRLGNAATRTDLSARKTRQNPNGNRRGLECPEERDYYPYWRPTPWIDLAVMTTDTSRCGYYEERSQNNAAKWECVGNELESFHEKNQFPNKNGNDLAPLTQAECVASKKGKWVRTPSWNEAAAETFLEDPGDGWNFTCMAAPTSVVNHLGMGNTRGTHHQTFHWKLPNVKRPMRNCVLRMRYNISTTEVDWDYDSSDNGKTVQHPTLGEIPIQNDPYIEVQPGIYNRLAVDTSQYGRTFQDRTHTFTILPRSSKPELGSDDTVLNVNVMGKRGNIAQVRNCVEYGFIPRVAEVKQSDFVHFQWDGTDYNDENNDGEGKKGTDRSNLVMTNAAGYTYPPDHEKRTSFAWHSFLGGAAAEKKMATLDQDFAKTSDTEDDETKCYSADFYKNGKAKNKDQSLKNCALLNGAISPHFPGMLRQMDKTGTYYAKSTRNDNFSNRSQKLQLTVTENKSNAVAIAVGVTVGAVCVLAAAGLAYKFDLISKAKEASIFKSKI